MQKMTHHDQVTETGKRELQLSNTDFIVGTILDT